ncbi:MAG: effector-associated constant component EACC1 [Pseudonocardiaceae bacterium]
MELEFRAGDSDLHGELRSLYEWLRRADDLRKSSMRMVHEPVRPGAMGADISHLLVELWPLEVVVLGTVVTAWLRTRGVDIDVERSQEKIKVSIRRARKGDTAEIGEQLFALLRETDAHGGAGPAGPTGGEPRDD